MNGRNGQNVFFNQADFEPTPPCGKLRTHFERNLKYYFISFIIIIIIGIIVGVTVPVIFGKISDQ